MLKNINFLYNGQNFCLECHEEKTMELIFKRYISEIGKDIKNLFFLYNGDLVNPEKPISELKEEKGIIQILVFDLEKEEDEEEVIEQSKEIICPICKEACMISFKDYKITFSNCKNGHICSNILFNEFNDFQKIMNQQ